METEKKQTLVNIRDLSVGFKLRKQQILALREVSFSLYKNEVLVLVGESGSGKTVLTRAMTGLLAANGSVTGGTIELEGSPKSWDKMQEENGSFFASVFQDASSAFSPVSTVGSQIRDIIIRRTGCNKQIAREKAISLLQQMEIVEAERCYDCYPFQLSGGMLQRAVIAAALACDPKVLICDEATTALDVTVQAQILKLLCKIQRERKISVLMITHDFGVAAKTADRIAVMYAGKIVEIGTADEIFFDPRHPYTWMLLSCMPQLQDPGKPFIYLRGTQKVMYQPPKGDPFAPRNPYCIKLDLHREPPLFAVSKTHMAATWLAHPDAPYFPRPEILDHLPENHDREMSPLSENPGKEQDYLLEIKNLCVTYGKGRQKKQAVKNVSLEIGRGEILALVGESGSGKTSTGMAIAGFVPKDGGEVYLDGENITRNMKKHRREIQMVFQGQGTALNDRASVEEIVAEGLDNFYPELTAQERRDRILDVIRSVGLLPEHLSRYPHELSGGQRQRLGIARALIVNPSLMIADEPVYGIFHLPFRLRSSQKVICISAWEFTG